MSAVIEAPIEIVEALGDLHLPPRADQRLQVLMDRNNNGALTPEEREQLEALVELSEAIAIVRGHGSPSGSSRVTRAGWLGSSWRQPASPQRVSLGSGGVALRASTPATPEL